MKSPGAARQEAEAFAKAASLDTHKALVHIFFAQRATKKARPRARAHSACKRGQHRVYGGASPTCAARHGEGAVAACAAAHVQHTPSPSIGVSLKCMQRMCGG